MEQHVRVIGIIDIVFGVLGVIGGVSLILASLVGAGAVGISGERGAAGLAAVIGSLGLAFGFILVALGALYLVTGIKLRQFVPWSRIAQIVLGILSLPSFPIGTAFGIYVLVILFNKETQALFEAKAAG